MPGPSRSAGFWALLRSVGRDPSDHQSRDPLQRDQNGHKRELVVIMCVLTALGLWLLLSLDDPGEIRLELQTTVANQPEDMAFGEVPATSVMASVKGDVLTLFKLKFRPPRFVIDASQDVIDSQTAVDWPTGIVAEFDSPQITLARETRIQRAVPIKLRVSIQPATGYSLFDDPTVTPDSVTIAGAASIVGSIDAWPTVSLRRVGIKDSLSFEVSLLDSLTGLVMLSHERIRLLAHAHKFTEGIRELRVVVTDIPNSENVVDLDPPSVEVIFHAPLDQFDSVREAEGFYATVSYEAIRLDTTGSVVPEITLPADLLVRLMGTQPSSLNYYVNTGVR